MSLNLNAHATNRHLRPSIIELAVGDVPLIDTIRVRGHIRDHDLHDCRWRRVGDPDGTINDSFVAAETALTDGRLRVESRNGCLSAVIERSLPTMASGHNLHALSLERAIPLIGALYEQAAMYVDWAESATDLSVTRLDLDRDFDNVYDLDRLLTGLAQIPVSRARNAETYRDNEHGEALTIVRGVPNSWRAMIYDKHAQMQASGRQRLRHAQVHSKSTVALQPPAGFRSFERFAASIEKIIKEAHGRARFEVQLRTAALRSNNIVSVADLNEALLLCIRKRYFNRAHFGTPVRGSSHLDGLMQRLARDGDPTYQYL